MRFKQNYTIKIANSERTHFTSKDKILAMLDDMKNVKIEQEALKIPIYVPIPIVEHFAAPIVDHYYQN